VGYSEWGRVYGMKEPTERRAKVLWGCSIQTLHQTRDIQAVIHTPYKENMTAGTPVGTGNKNRTQNLQDLQSREGVLVGSHLCKQQAQRMS